MLGGLVKFSKAFKGLCCLLTSTFGPCKFRQIKKQNEPMKMMMMKVMVILKTIKSIFKTAKQFEDQIEMVSKTMNFKPVWVYGECFRFGLEDKSVKFRIKLHFPANQLNDENIIATAKKFIGLKYGVGEELTTIKKWNFK